MAYKINNLLVSDEQEQQNKFEYQKSLKESYIFDWLRNLSNEKLVRGGLNDGKYFFDLKNQEGELISYCICGQPQSFTLSKNIIPSSWENLVYSARSTGSNVIERSVTWDEFFDLVQIVQHDVDKTE